MATVYADEKIFKAPVTFEGTVQGALTVTDDLTAADAVTFAALPQYADDAAAGGGGLTAGRLYRTATGVVMVKLA